MTRSGDTATGRPPGRIRPSHSSWRQPDRPRRRGIRRDQVRLMVTGARRDPTSRLSRSGFRAAGQAISWWSTTRQHCRHRWSSTATSWSTSRRCSPAVSMSSSCEHCPAPTRSLHEHPRAGDAAAPRGRDDRAAHPLPGGCASRGSGWPAPTWRPLIEYLETWGRPIRYQHTDGPYPLDAYQTIFARVPGSAEMPSAGRPFTDRLLTALAATGAHRGPGDPSHRCLLARSG